MTVMSAETRALLDAAKATCKTSTEKLTTSLPWVPKPRAVATDSSWDPVKAQVREICTGIKIGTERAAAKRERMERITNTRALCSDLQRYAAEVQTKPTPRRNRRHWLTDPGEIAAKVVAEVSSRRLIGILPELLAEISPMLDGVVEPSHEEWARPEAMTLYCHLMAADPGTRIITDYEADDLRHLAWMCESELLDIDELGVIHLLSDEIAPAQRRYLGAPVPDERASIGRTHTAEDVQAFVLSVYNMIADGRPPMDIPAEYREEMTTRKGIRISGAMMTRQCNMLLAARIDQSCNCLGRDQVKCAWDLPDHGKGCAGRERWLSIDVVRRAIRELMESGELTRVANAVLTRRGHTEHRKAASYLVPVDAGWWAYATKGKTTRRKPMSRLRIRLLGDAKQAAPPLPDLEDAA